MYRPSKVDKFPNDRFWVCSILLPEEDSYTGKLSAVAHNPDTHENYAVVRNFDHPVLDIRGTPAGELSLAEELRDPRLDAILRRLHVKGYSRRTPAHQRSWQAVMNMLQEYDENYNDCFPQREPALEWDGILQRARESPVCYTFYKRLFINPSEWGLVRTMQSGGVLTANFYPGKNSKGHRLPSQEQE